MNVVARSLADAYSAGNGKSAAGRPPLRLSEGDEILTTDHEYGAMERTWRYVCYRTGARFVQQHIPTPVTTQADFIERFWSGVTPRTKVIFLSHITSPTAPDLPVGGNLPPCACGGHPDRDRRRTCHRPDSAEPTRAGCRHLHRSVPQVAFLGQGMRLPLHAAGRTAVARTAGGQLWVGKRPPRPLALRGLASMAGHARPLPVSCPFPPPSSSRKTTTGMPCAGAAISWRSTRAAGFTR